MKMTDSRQASPFKTFPEFSKLDFASRKAYESRLGSMPPLAEITFTSLVYWWQSVGDYSVSSLNDNLVISFWYPGDEDFSGFSVYGTNKLDESICTIFDYLQEQDRPVRLVHVSTSPFTEHLVSL